VISGKAAPMGQSVTALKIVVNVEQEPGSTNWGYGKPNSMNRSVGSRACLVGGPVPGARHCCAHFAIRLGSFKNGIRQMAWVENLNGRQVNFYLILSLRKLER
jgi:hypothetical protein